LRIALVRDPPSATDYPQSTMSLLESEAGKRRLLTVEIPVIER
jgi:hypothetical protein